MSISSIIPMIFGCFCFYSSAISPKEDRIQKFQVMMLPFTLNLSY